MPYLSVCGIFKDETDNLAEWIEYHKLIGVDHFYLINNNLDPEECMRVLRKYIDSGLVTHIHDPNTDAPQVPAYNRVLNEFAYNNQWMAFIDIDEYISTDTDTDLISILKLFDSDSRCASLILHWLLFGASGHITKPDLHIESYLHRCKYNDDGHRMVKSIVKPNRVKAMFTPHSAIPKDGYHNMNMFHQISVPNHLGHNGGSTYHALQSLDYSLHY